MGSFSPMGNVLCRALRVHDAELDFDIGYSATRSRRTRVTSALRENERQNERARLRRERNCRLNLSRLAFASDARNCVESKRKLLFFSRFSAFARRFLPGSRRYLGIYLSEAVHLPATASIECRLRDVESVFDATGSWSRLVCLLGGSRTATERHGTIWS